METVVLVIAGAYLFLQSRNIIMDNIRRKREKKKLSKIGELAERIESLIDRGLELNHHIMELYSQGDIDGADLLKEQADEDVEKINKLIIEHNKMCNEQDN